MEKQSLTDTINTTTDSLFKLKKTNVMHHKAQALAALTGTQCQQTLNVSTQKTLIKAAVILCIRSKWKTR